MSSTVIQESQGTFQPPVTMTSYYSQKGDSPEAGQAPSHGAVPPQALLNQQFLNVESSGLFTVPTTTNPLTMHIYVSSHIETAETVQVQINRLSDLTKITVFQTAIVVPAMGAVEIALDLGVFSLRGETVEVVIKTPDPLQIFQLLPSVDVVEFFPADGSTLPLVFIPPGEFSQVFPSDASATDNDAGAHQPPPPIVVSTGIFDVPQGVAAVRPRVHVILSSFSDETLTADVEVNRLVRGTTQKETVLTQTVEVPSGEARQLLVDDVEGLPIEVNFTLSRDEMGNDLLPSVHVTELFTCDETETSIILVPSGQMMGIFVPSLS